MDNIFTRLGRLIRVNNIKTRSFSHEKESYVAVLVKDEKTKDTQCLLFTDAEIARAEIRALKNQEDLLKRSFISKILD